MKNRFLKSLFLVFIAFFAFTALVFTTACGDKKEDDKTGENGDNNGGNQGGENQGGENQGGENNTEEKVGNYVIKVYDYDGTVIGEKTVAVATYANIYEAIQGEFTTVASLSEYGAWLTSINGSLVDPSWSLMFYVNGESSMVSCDAVKPAKDGVYEFKNECWQAVDYGYGAKFDAVDVLVDKAIYAYVKNQLKASVEGIKTYTGSTYWDMLFIEMYKAAGYDQSLINYTYTDELKAELAAVEVNTLAGANIGKYYSHAKVLGAVKDDFKAYYETVLAGQTEWNDYVTPFVVFPAKDLGITNASLEALAAGTINGSTEWGPAGNLWKLTAQALFADRTSALNMTEYVKAWDTAYSYGSNTDNATLLMAASSINVNVRDTEKYGKVTFEEKELDLLAYMFAKYYDETLGLMKVYTADTDVNFSTNQIYAGLLAYKVMRDSGKAANFFGYTAATPSATN